MDTPSCCLRRSRGFRAAEPRRRGSLIEMPATMSYWDQTREERYALSITDSLVRLSLGVEDGNDLIADLAQALASVEAEAGRPGARHPHGTSAYTTERPPIRVDRAMPGA